MIDQQDGRGRGRPRRKVSLRRAAALLVPAALLVVLGVACGPIKDVAQVSAGKFHTCAVMTDGTVQCWGLNDGGQLGDGTTASSKGPVEVVGIAGIASVSAGWDHTCARNTGGVVFCWGHNEKGQLGNGTTTNSSVPVVAQLYSASLSAGNGTTCTVAPAFLDSTVSCWGWNNKGQVGDGTTTNRTVPTVIAGTTGTTSVSVGNQTTCATNYPDPLRCWGSNSNHEFGNGNTTNSLVPVNAFTATLLLPVTTLAPERVAVGNGHVCVTVPFSLANPELNVPLCAGRNDAGQLGFVGDDLGRVVPASVGGTAYNGVNATLTAGDNFTCASDSGKHAICWGYGADGQLGNGGTASSAVAVNATSVVNPESISAGYRHACAVGSGATLTCWGDNSGYQIGNGSSADAVSPVAPQAQSRLGGIVEIDGGYFHTCARTTDGTIQCFGSNAFGQLGNGSTTTSADPVPIPGLSGVTEVSSNGWHNCARLSDGTARCWGLNRNGQLGRGDTVDSSTPVTVKGLPGSPNPATLTDVAAVAAGADHSCALLTNGTVACWGDDAWGQLGNGLPLADSGTPLLVSGITSAVAIASGESHSCALLSDGAVRCWGRADRGQLGQSYAPFFTYNAQPAPAVTGLAAATSITAGADHNCAQLSGGGLACWGRNDYGQLGDGGTTDSVAAVTVYQSAPNSMHAVDAGAYHTCALLGNGTAACWGANYSGQLGDGTTVPHAFPNPAWGTVTPVALGAGGSHTCAVVPNSQADCWGQGDSGQLGNGGTPASLPYPQSVLTAGYRWQPS